MALTNEAHHAIRTHFDGKAKTLAVDATCGNGFDTQFLIELGFAQVVGFDIQAIAIETTTKRIKHLGLKTPQLFQVGHELMPQYIHSQIDCVMFNFGYLPNGDKTLTTQAENSCKAVLEATDMLRDSGLITLICYPGHPSGLTEATAIKALLSKLDSTWCIETRLSVSPKPATPILHLLKRAPLVVS